MDARLKLLGVLAVVLFLTSCTTVTIPPTKVVSDYCSLSRPIMLSKVEIPKMTAETKRQILVHNEIWELKCNTPDKAR